MAAMLALVIHGTEPLLPNPLLKLSTPSTVYGLGFKVLTRGL